jgi:hypothetical protein
MVRRESWPVFPALLFLAALVLVPAAVTARDAAAADPEPPFVICDEPYALCAAASCFVYDGVAYCACDLERGDSISLQLDFTTPTGDVRNACDLDREGRANGYLVSTYSLPADAEKGGRGAVYTCPGADNARGGVAAPVAYGQCDGGLCFTSTVGRRFPGFEPRLARDEIICSCPISTSATPGSAGPLGYQVFGPYAPKAPPGERCDPRGCAACSVAAPTANGSIVPVGAPTGSAEFLTLRLDGPPLPPLNRCSCACTTAADGSTSCAVASDDSDP